MQPFSPSGQAAASGTTLSFLRPDEDGIPRSRADDATGEILEQVYGDGTGNILHGYEYGRDRTGFQLYERRLHNDGSLGDATRDAWRYDSVYRIALYLPNVFDPRVPPDDPLEKIVFYPDGNHSWRFLEVNFSTRRLTVNPRSGYETSNDDTFTYDAAGSLQSSGKLSFAYDAFRRLRTARRDGRTVGLYSYDERE